MAEKFKKNDIVKVTYKYRLTADPDEHGEAEATNLIGGEPEGIIRLNNDIAGYKVKKVGEHKPTYSFAQPAAGAIVRNDKTLKEYIRVVSTERSTKEPSNWVEVGTGSRYTWDEIADGKSLSFTRGEATFITPTTFATTNSWLYR